MLWIDVPDIEIYDELKNEFSTIKGRKLQLEHSLISISKWEQKWEKPFLTDAPRSMAEIRDYIRCMTITQNVDEDLYSYLPVSTIEEIFAYINRKMTAATFKDDHRGRSRAVITAEDIYYLMFSNNIPLECQTWHLNRLLALIRTFSVKNEPPKKMSKKAILAQNRELNAARRKALGTRG